MPPTSSAPDLAEPNNDGNAPALSVTELSLALKRHVETGFAHIRVRGEISGWKRAASGHAYLCLKDADATLDGVMWKTAQRPAGFTPGDGIEVIATGRLTTFPGRSRYQLVIERMELAGEGAMLALLERRRLQLLAEGLFEPARKRPLPYLPRRIGVVTSPTGAVIRDILHRLADRFPTHVIVWPVQVQGQGAAEQVAAAVAGFSALAAHERPDLVIVARGGGSIEDLWAFNEEAVVRAVAASLIPVISAVGHETDTTLCDHAADLRAPTPTAAAELAVPVLRELAELLDGQGRRMTKCAWRYQERGRERVDALARCLPRPSALLEPQAQRADELGERLERALVARAGHAERDLARAAATLRPALLATKLSNGNQSLQQLWRVAQSLHPDRPLARGYAMVTARDGRPVVSAAAARKAGALTLRFGDGAVPAKVEPDARPAYRAPQQERLF